MFFASAEVPEPDDHDAVRRFFPGTDYHMDAAEVGGTDRINDAAGRIL